MSNVIDQFVSFQRIAQVAMEEASRFSLPEADVEHLFVALVVSDERAGVALRSMGITLASAREAVADVHSARLASLGIRADLPQQQRMDCRDLLLRPRAREIAGRALGADDYSAALLRDLVDEPSGLVESILAELGATPSAVTAKVDATAGRREVRPRAAADGLLGTHETFVPASVDQVWALLADPRHMTKWGPSYARVDCDEQPLDAFPGDAWVGRVRAGGRGRSGQPREGQASERVELLCRVERTRLVWRFSTPDAPHLNSRRVHVDLKPTTAGANVRATVAWEPRRDGVRRPFLSALLLPVKRYAVRSQAAHVGASIGRAVR